MEDEIIKMYWEHLPRWETKKNNGKINVRECIGHKCKFTYKGIDGEVEIIGVDKRCFIIKYLDKKPFKIAVGSFVRCMLGKLLGTYTNEFKYEVGQALKDDKRDLVITKRESRYGCRNIRYKWYKYTCNVCGWTEGWMTENHLRGGYGCSSCRGLVVTKMNNILSTAPWMIDLGVSEEDAVKHTCGSQKKIKVTCPTCEYQKEIYIYAIHKNKSIGCRCSDKMPYPEKFTTNMLIQLGIEFETQYNHKCIEGKFYDFYIPSLNMIIETHGVQHYKESFTKLGGRTLQEEQDNDKLKEQLALDNGIDKYIVVDCRKSEFEWIKDNIIYSVGRYIDLSNIDWNKCEEFALSNLVKEVCDYWRSKQEWETTKTIADNNSWGIKSSYTIRDYIKKGTKLGWCNYDPKEDKGRYKTGKNSGKKVEIFKGDQSLGIFESVSELERQSEELFDTKLNTSNISAVCLGKREHHKGYIFKYID